MVSAAVGAARPRVLVILDGAAEDPGRGPTSLELARTPVLDALAAEGEVRRVRTIPEGLPAGSEVGIPVLLGVRPAVAPGRGLLEAAALGIEPPEGSWAWRVDVPRGFVPREVPPGLRHLRGHRYLWVGEAPPRLGPPWRIWPRGGELPGRLGPSTVIVAAPGVAAGCGRLLGARVVIPPGATGDVDTDHAAKVRAAVGALADARQVVVHLGAPDEASHRLDRAGKVAAFEAIDALVLGPLREEVGARGGVLEVACDHGTDPATGEHLADPVPSLRWGAGVEPAGPSRFVERALAEEVGAA